MGHNSSIYRFEDFELDAKAKILRRNGQPVSIHLRTFQVLQCLIERQGEIVGKEDFFNTVWKDTFVEDNSLTVAIAALRKLLGDDAKRPRFIENVPRHGYRFIADVASIHPPHSAQDAIEVPPRALEPPVASITHRSGTRYLGRLARRPATYVVISMACLILLLVGGLADRLFGRGQGSLETRDTSVLIMPFEPHDVTYRQVAEELTESVFKTLSGDRKLSPIRIRSTILCNGVQIDASGLAREIKARSVITARLVSKSGSLNLEAELTDVATGNLLWQKRYAVDLADLSPTNEQISNDVSYTLFGAMHRE